MDGHDKLITPRSLDRHSEGSADQTIGPLDVGPDDHRSAQCGPALPQRARTLLLGMGNPILSDDAIGVRLAASLGERLSQRTDVDVLAECSVGGLNLLDVVKGYERVIVIDSIKTTGGRVGSWYRFDATSLQSTMNLRNVHDTNVATALKLGREMGMSLPSDEAIHVFAIEIGDNLTFSEMLTADLAAALPELLQEIGAEVGALLNGSGTSP